MPSASRPEANQIGIALLVGCALVTALVITSAQDDSAIGSPAYWSWLLTGLQVTALGAAARGREWGWLLGAAVQLPWIAYALVTGQVGFIPGCAVSTVVQIHGFHRRQTPPTRREADATVVAPDPVAG